MSDLSDLYQEVILDHNKRPRNYGTLAAATHHAAGHNPLCGDKLRLDVLIDDGRIADLKFEGSGCAISKASASLMTDAIKGQSIDDAIGLFDRFHAMVTAPLSTSHDDASEGLGKLAALAGVREFPVRIKCASLAWHTLKAALSGGAIAKTE